MYLLAYHKRNDERCFFAKGTNPFEWQEFSILDHKMRDPFLFYDKQYYIYYTDGIGGKTLNHATSKDLVNWKYSSFSNSEWNLLWAPERHQDSIICTIEIEGKKRIYSIKNNKTSLFFDPGYEVIDANICKFQDKTYMAFKDETPEYKAIRICELIDGKWANISDPITEPSTEGPFMFEYENKLYLMYDCYMKNEIKIKEIGGKEVLTHFPKDVGHPSYIKIHGC